MSSSESDSNFKALAEQLQQLKGQCASVFLRKCNSIESAVERLEEQINILHPLVRDELEERCATLQELIKSSCKEQENCIFELIQKVDSIGSSLFLREYPIDVRFERDYYKEFPTGPTVNFPNFQHEFLRLLDGLDSESQENICLAIQRLKIIQNSQDAFMALYSQEEKGVLRQVREHFMSNVLPLGDNCFSLREYLLPINHFESCVFWDRCGVTHLDHPERLKNRDIIDAGAFIGDSALIFSPLTTQNVYAFEPTPSNYAYMEKTIELNGLKNVIPCPYALGDREGTAVLSINGSSSTQFENDAFRYEDKTEVKVVQLDSFVRENNLNVGLLKADVEGAEQLLLKGAWETIRTQKPALLISIYHNADDFFHIKPMLEKLDLGYRFKIRHPVCGSVMTETILIAEAD